MDCKENDFGEKGLKGSKQGNASSIKKEEYVEPMKSSSSATMSCSSSSYLSSSQDLEDDASSSSSNSSHSSGPLYDLNDLMAQLPIKRGLSKYYNGKSQTFTSLTDVESVEDLAKKDEGCSYSRRMKSSKSFGGSSNSKHHRKLGPKASINKEANCKRSVSHSMAAKLWIL